MATAVSPLISAAVISRKRFPNCQSVQRLVSVLWNDWDASGIPGSGIFYNGGLPGRAVFTWLNNPEYPSGVNKPRVTIQVILFADGRIQFGYNGVAVPVGVTGISAGPGSPLSVVDFSSLGTFSFNGPATIAQQFSSFSLFDMDGSFITWTPNAAAGFDMRVVAGAVTGPRPVAAWSFRPVGRASGTLPTVRTEPEERPGKATSISLVSRAGAFYRLEASAIPDDDDASWGVVSEPIAGDGGEISIPLPDPTAAAVRVFYRIMRIEP